MNSERWQLMRFLAVVVCFASLSIAGCTATIPSGRASTGLTRLGASYLTQCPALSNVSTEIRGLVQQRKVRGPELDCDYGSTGSPFVQVAFTYSGLSSAATLSKALVPLIGRENLTPISGVGNAAYEYATPNGEVSVVAIAHGYTISVLASGLAPSVVAEVARIAVGAWKH